MYCNSNNPEFNVWQNEVFGGNTSSLSLGFIILHSLTRFLTFHYPNIYSQGFFLQSSTVPWLNNKLNKWTVIHIQLYIRWARQFPYDWMMWRIDKKREFMIFWIFLIQPNFFKTCRINLDNIKIYISVNTVEGYCLKKLLVTIELIL